MVSLFEAAEYAQYRLHYPRAIFEPLKPYLAKGAHILDLGAGTGFVTASFLEFFAECEFTLLEPDSEMLKAATKRLQNFPQPKHFVLGKAEAIPLPEKSVDLVLIGSAWHWMNFEQTTAMLAKILKPGGVVFVFEYQFPKAAGAASELNEWVRRQFNLNWRAPAQTPRGSLDEITESFRQASSFAQVAKVELIDSQSHAVHDFGGMIFSQSRFLHFESGKTPDVNKLYRNEVLEELKKKWGLQNEIQFLYPFQGYVFQRRPD